MKILRTTPLSLVCITSRVSCMHLVTCFPSAWCLWRSCKEKGEDRPCDMYHRQAYNEVYAR